VNETYLGNAQVKKDGVQQGWTKEDVQEYQRCMTDPVYFAETYGKVISLDKGLVSFKLYPYQREMFEHFNDNRFSIVLACRQSGKSISSCMYILWYALFHPDQTIAILANKGATAREMLARITLALENTPFFLQPGTKALNKGSIEFSNNSRIIAAATSGSSIRGLSVNLLFLDEFAFVENAAQFYASTYPVISSGKTSRVIITSTANGIGNVFHKIYEGAVQEVNEFKPFRVDWWDVPGRDDKWKQQTIANTSELHSTFNIIDITTRPFKQVACYRNNLISPILYPDIIHKWAKRYNEAYVIVESNDQGAVVANGLYYDIEYENTHVESMIKAGAIGMTMNRKVKRIGCSNLKDLIEEKRLEIVDLNTISECSTFEARGNSFEASDGNHDDLVMNLVMFAWYVGSEAFINQTDVNLKQLLYEEKMKQIEDEVVPMGIIDDGINTTENTSSVWEVVEKTELF
jgi:hypothetical protein